MGIRAITLKRSASVLAVATSLAMPGVAYGQNAAATETPTNAQPSTANAVTAQTDTANEVVVTGIRASLERSIAIKRDSSGVVDAISSEDIGKFPDTNLAESLQRITGVSINRVNGEGSQVTVRGFGPGYNLVTLNGRTLATSDTVGGSGGTSRSFDFDNLASEGVKTLEVYKTGRAAIPSGGIGATINVVTRSPLEAKDSGFSGSIGAKADYDTSSKECYHCGSKVTPEVSGLVSWSDNDQRVGVSLFGSYQQRHFANMIVNAGGWNIVPWSTAQTFLTPTATVTNAPTSPNTLVGIVDSSQYYFSEDKRTRINGDAIVQFAPTDSLTFTADGLFAQTTLQEVSHVEGNWFNRPFDQITFDGNKTLDTATFYHETLNPTKDLGMEQGDTQTRNRLWDYGLNAKWDITDNFRLNVDGHMSRASSLPNDPNGRGQTLISFGGYGVHSHSLDFSDHGWPIQQFDFDDTAANGSTRQGNRNGVLDAGDIGSQVGRTNTTRQTQRLKELRADAGWDLGQGSRFDFGSDYRSSNMHSNSQSTYQTLGDWSVNHAGDVESISPGMLEQYCIACKFHHDMAPIGAAAIAFRVANPYALYDKVSAFYTARGSAPAVTATADNRVKESIWATYGQVTWKGQLAGHEASLVAGVRYERTTTTSTTLQTVPQAIRWDADNDFFVVYSNEQQAVSQKGHYNNLLPSMDFQVNLKQNLVGRFSFSKTLARTDYSNLFAATSVGTPNRPTAIGGIPIGNAGNPSLQPLLSDNFDLSLEWYYKPGSYLSAGFFEKRVHNFVGNGVTNKSLFGLRDASSGAAGTRSGVAKTQLQAIGADISDVNLFTYTALLQQNAGSTAAATNTFVANYDPTSRSLNQAFVDATLNAVNILADDSDPLFNFAVAQPINNRDAKIWGFELAGTHFFGRTGFGVAASYTLVRGNVGFDNGADPSVDQFALLGLSDTASGTLIYDKSGISARLSYNWRAHYLSRTNVDNYHNPNYIAAFGQLDFNVSYDLTPRLALSIEGVNLTNEGIRVYGRSKNEVFQTQDLDRRFMIGARYKF